MVFGLYKIVVINDFKNSRCQHRFQNSPRLFGMKVCSKEASLRRQGAPSLGKLNGVGQTCIFV